MHADESEILSNFLGIQPAGVYKLWDDLKQNIVISYNVYNGVPQHTMLYPKHFGSTTISI